MPLAPGRADAMHSPRVMVPPLDFRTAVQPWPHMQAPYPPQQYSSPRVQTPREIITRLDDVVSEMERDIVSETLGTKSLFGSLPRVVDLERELEDSLRKNRDFPQRIAELEGQVFELHRIQANHDKECNHYRSRISELERELGTAEASDEKYKEQYAFLNQRILDYETTLLQAGTKEKQNLHYINELEHQLAKAEDNNRHLDLQLANQRQQCELLEQELDSLRRDHAHVTKGHESGIADNERLRQLLSETESAHGHLGLQQTKHVGQIKQLELIIEESRATEERQKHLIAELRLHIKGLEQELGDAPTSDHRQTLAELHQKIQGYTEGEDKWKKQEKAWQQKVDNIVCEMEELRSRAGEQLRNHQDQQKSLRKRLEDMEKELLDSHSVADKHREQNKQLQRQLADGGFSDLEKRLEAIEREEAALLRELDSAKADSADLRQSHDKIQKQASQVSQDAEIAMESLDRAFRAEEAELLFKVDHDSQRPSDSGRLSVEQVGKLEEQLDVVGMRKNSNPGDVLRARLSSHGSDHDQSRRSRSESAVTLKSASSNPKFGMPMAPSRSILPESDHVFVAKVRQTLQEVSDAMQRLVTLQVDVIANQLANMSGVKHDQMQREKREELLEELRIIDTTIDDLIPRLKAQAMEIEVHTDIRPEEKQELAKVLHMETQICEDELRLLRESHMGTLGDLPRELVDGLVAMHLQGAAPGQTLHMAAEYGRRDIVEYILRSSPNSRKLLTTRDPLNRTPLEVAHHFGNTALERWLQEAVLKEAQPQRRSLKVLNTGDTSPFASQMPGSDEFALSHSSSASSVPQQNQSVTLPLPRRSGESARDSVLSLQWDSRTSGIHVMNGGLISRPSFKGFSLPPAFEELLTKIESSGWDSVDWKEGYTMLHWAAGKGQGILCRYLISLGADNASRDNRGRLPADMARINGFSDVAELLSTTL